MSNPSRSNDTLPLEPIVESIHFVTGKLAESAVREYVEKLSREIGFHYTIEVLPITVAALMTPKWLLRHVHVPDKTTRMIVPGCLDEGLEEIQHAVSCRVECGPKDIRDLPLHFGKKPIRGDDYGKYSIEILAEINIAPRWPVDDLLQLARKLANDGANCIDLGCQPGHRWTEVAQTVHRMRDLGLRCSIDTFDPWEAAEAVRAGAELVLSVNASNRDAAIDWGAEVVVVPDTTEVHGYLGSLEDTAMFLEKHRVPFRIDPILEPIGCGFAASINRYQAVRTHFPEVPMMMGIGNLTELTDCDSAGINFLLLSICEEWKIHSVLTTQVIPWAQSSVRECDLARRMVHYAVRNGIPPKRLDSNLVMLRDPRVNYFSEATIAQLASSIKDNNYRILVDSEKIHLIAAGVHLQGTDPFAIMEELMTLPQSSNVDSSHAFYLGFELSKAATALTLGKQYEQDMALQWGMLTQPENHHRLVRRHRKQS